MSRFRRVLAIVGVAGIGVIVLAPGASATTTHPLGNFTVNTYTGLRVGTDRLVIDRVVDSAEIPTVQAQRSIDTDGNGTESAVERTAYRDRQCASLARTTSVKLGTTSRRLAITRATLAFPAGSAGLDTMRLECTLETPVTVDEAQRLVVTTTDAVGEIGWHEMTAVGDGVTLDHSPLPTTSLSDRLHTYPANRIQSPPDVTRGSVLVRGGGRRLSDAANPGRAIAASSLSAVPGIDRASSSFTDLISTRDLTLWAASLAVVVAIFLGSLHALAPGHGKTVMAAYLVGERGSVKDGLLIGVTVATTHTLGVLLLGAVLTASQTFAPESVYPYLSLASGVCFAGLGITLFVGAIRRRRGGIFALGHHHHGPGGHTHDAPTEVAHTHDANTHVSHSHAAHSHDAPGHDVEADATKPLSRKSLLTLGFAGGLVPTPTAVVVLLGATAIGRAWFGALLVVAYGIGMGATLVLAGLVFAKARRRFDLANRSDRAMKIAAIFPVATAAVITTSGLWLVARAAISF